MGIPWASSLVTYCNDDVLSRLFEAYARCDTEKDRNMLLADLKFGPTKRLNGICCAYIMNDIKLFLSAYLLFGDVNRHTM